MTRWKASAIHLSISALIAITVTFIMVALWYKPPLISATGGYQLLMLLLLVDVALGPLMTLIIFNTKKPLKELKIDLSIIAIIQLSALLYGMFIVYETRPVFTVFYKNAFYLVNANLLNKEDLALATSYHNLPLTGPKYVYVEMPADKEKRHAVYEKMFLGKGLYEYPQYFQPYQSHTVEITNATHSLGELRNLNPQDATTLDKAILETGKSEVDLSYLPLRAKHQDLVVLVGKNDGKIYQLLNLKPWQ